MKNACEICGVNETITAENTTVASQVGGANSERTQRESGKLTDIQKEKTLPLTSANNSSDVKLGPPTPTPKRKNSYTMRY